MTKHTKPFIVLLFRRDLRLNDNPALNYALSQAKTDGLQVMALVQLEPPEQTLNIKASASCVFWYQSLIDFNQSLSNRLFCLYSSKENFLKTIKKLAQLEQLAGFYANSLNEPKQEQQDHTLAKICAQYGVTCHFYPSYLLHHPNDFHNQSGGVYRVFTPFYKRLALQLEQNPPLTFKSPKPKELDDLLASNQYIKEHSAFTTLNALGVKPFSSTIQSQALRHLWQIKLKGFWKTSEHQAQQSLSQFIDHTLARYHLSRDFFNPLDSSRLSPYLHFGQLSARQVWVAVKEALEHSITDDRGAQGFLRQLIWREFSYYLMNRLQGFPFEELHSKYKQFSFNNDELAFKSWTKGNTGYPIVDAAMRQLWQTGFIPNRARLIVASFLCKNLLIDWKKGANWFMQCLVDADVANNGAGWQWVFGCGADASPYFRIFNPILQAQKFDPKGEYVKQWLPEIKNLPHTYIHQPFNAPSSALKQANIQLGNTYPQPIIDLSLSRKRALEAYYSLA